MTKAKIIGLLAAVVGAFLTFMPASGAEDPPKAYVVIVGIGDYPDKQIKPRKHAETDARALYDLFNDKTRLAAPENVKLLLGTKDATRPSEVATKENILKALKWATSSAGPNDPVIFAFLGQGAPVGDRLGFMAADSTFKDRAKNAVLGSDIENALDKMKTQRFLAMVDINLKGFDNPNPKEPLATNVNDLVRIFFGHEERDDGGLPSGRVLLLATNGLTQSLDMEKNGLFTHALLDAFKGSADKEGYEPDGNITVDELILYLGKQVPELARVHGKTKEEKEQMFFARGGQESHFPVVRNPGVMTKVNERIDKFAEMAREKKLAAEVIEEGNRLLGLMPKLQAYQDLRKAYQKLSDGALTLDDFNKEREKIQAGMKLKRSESVAYATKVVQLINVLREQYVKEVNQGDMVVWGVKGLYRRIDEKKVPPEIKERLDKAKTLKEADLIQLLADVRDRIGRREDLANDKDVDTTVQMMLLELKDPYTNYIDKEMLARFQQEMRGHFTGIGIQIRKEVASDHLLVVTPLKGSPAYKAGVKAGDVITAIKRKVDSEGKPLAKEEVITTKGMSISDAVAKILGAPKTQVTVVVEREGVEKPLEFTIERDLIQVETVMGFKRKATDDWDYLIDPENKIVYLRLTQFARNSFRDLRQVVRDHMDKGGIRGFVLDLRNNPGGLLQSAVDISDLFIDDGVIVSIRPRVGQEHSFQGEHDGSLLSFPMVCLVNGGSASGSEIVSACLQDHKRALIIGERSFGKGSVQNVLPFKPTGGEIKLTTASFWRPSGKNLNKSTTGGKEEDDWGVIPDKVVPLTRDDRDQLAEHQRDTEIIPRRDVPPKEVKTPFKDVQLDMAIDYLKGQIKSAAKPTPKKAG